MANYRTSVYPNVTAHTLAGRREDSCRDAVSDLARTPFHRMGAGGSIGAAEWRAVFAPAAEILCRRANQDR
jgi:hypothetical protein